MDFSVRNFAVKYHCACSFSSKILHHWHKGKLRNLKFCVSTNRLINSFILVFTGQCLLLCVALKTSNHWSTSIGLSGDLSHIYADRWTTELSYVCQYHSKSLYGLSLSVYQSSPVSLSTDDAVSNQQSLWFLCWVAAYAYLYHAVHYGKLRWRSEFQRYKTN